MTNNELKKWNNEAQDRITKGLECCIKETSDCDNCPLYVPGDADCVNILKAGALDIINRQKAEIEQLEKDKENLACSFANAVGQKMTAKSDAIKEFAERLETMFNAINNNLPMNYLVKKTAQMFINTLQLLKEEMVEGSNG